jgi:hypothetical protein
MRIITYILFVSCLPHWLYGTNEEKKLQIRYRIGSDLNEVSIWLTTYGLNSRCKKLPCGTVDLFSAVLSGYKLKSYSIGIPSLNHFITSESMCSCQLET